MRNLSLPIGILGKSMEKVDLGSKIAGVIVGILTPELGVKS